MQAAIKLACVAAYMTNARNEQRRTKSGSCELPRLGSDEVTERLGLRKNDYSQKARKEAAMIYQKVSADMKFVDREKEVEKFWNEEDGMGVVEIVLITVVLIGLVIIFKSQITSLVNKLLSKMTSQANKI